MKVFVHKMQYECTNLLERTARGTTAQDCANIWLFCPDDYCLLSCRQGLPTFYLHLVVWIQCYPSISATPPASNAVLPTVFTPEIYVESTYCATWLITCELNLTDDILCSNHETFVANFQCFLLVILFSSDLYFCRKPRPSLPTSCKLRRFGRGLETKKSR